MQNVIVFILGIVVGVVVGGKLGYEYVTAQVSENMTTIVNTVMTEGLGTGGQALLKNYEGQAQAFLDEQKGVIQEEIKKQLQDYISKKVDGLFN